MFRFSSLAIRYGLFFLLAIGLIFFVAFTYSYIYSMALLMEGAKKDADILTKQTVASFENALQPIELVPQTLVEALKNPQMSYGDILRISHEFVKNNPVVFGTCLAFEPGARHKEERWDAPYFFEGKGGVETRMLGGKDYDYFKKDWYRLPKLLGKPVWTEPYNDVGGGDTMMCTYSVPFYREHDGKSVFTGVLTMDISLHEFSKIVKEINVYKTGYGFLVSREGYIISAPQTFFENRNILDLAKAGKGKSTIRAIRKMMNGQSGFVSMDGLGAQRNSSFLSFSPVGSTGWAFGIVFPADELLDDLLSFLKDILWIFVYTVLALLVITMLITRRLTRPIVKLVDATKMIGHGDFDIKLPVRKSRDEIAQLTQAFATMRDELKSYIVNLQETTSAKEKIESELKVAHSIQMGMLPRGFVTPANWDLFAALDPAKAVGGDLYDFFYLDPDHLCIAIGDVAGKGVPASLFMMVTRTLLRAKLLPGSSISQVIGDINNELCRDNPNQMFVTFFAGIVNLKTGIMQFCNAGHNYPYVLSPDGTLEQIKVRNGIPLGVFEHVDYTASTYAFTPREILILTTDGITDALNSSNDFFGEAKLAAALTNFARKNTRVLTEMLIGELKRFSQGAEQADDITILALQYKEQAGVLVEASDSESMQIANDIAELPGIAAKIEELSERWSLPPKTAMELNLAVEELFSNVVFYAFDDQARHVISLTFILGSNGKLVIKLEDDGKPFNLLEQDHGRLLDMELEERPVGGLGIHFIRKVMDNVEYQREGNRNIVILTKNS